MTPTPEAIEAAKEWTLKENPTCDSAEHWFHLQVKAFLAGAEFGDAQGYARAKSEMEAENDRLYLHWCNARDGHRAVTLNYESEIAQLKKELDSKKNLLKDIYEEWDEPCDSSCDSWAHSPSCKAINIVEAKRAMRLEIAELKQEIATITQKGEMLCCAHGNTLMEIAQLKQANAGLVEALERIEKPDYGKIDGMIIADMGFTHFAQLTATRALAAARKGETCSEKN